MNVWIKFTRKPTACKYCEKVIEIPEPQVVCQYFMKTKSRMWEKKMIFHPQCWIDRAIVELSARVVVETRGRKRAQISDVDRESRNRILRKRASVVQRINSHMGRDKPNYEKVEKLLDDLGKLRGEIELVGGIPGSWN